MSTNTEAVRLAIFGLAILRSAWMTTRQQTSRLTESDDELYSTFRDLDDALSRCEKVLRDRLRSK